jgi:hypothetical protein
MQLANSFLVSSCFATLTIRKLVLNVKRSTLCIRDAYMIKLTISVQSDPTRACIRFYKPEVEAIFVHLLFLSLTQLVGFLLHDQ